MGITQIFMGLAVVIMLATFFTFLFLLLKKDKKKKRTRIFSYVIFGWLIFHWLFFLANGYALLPTNIGIALFTPIWLILCGVGVIAAIYEFKNNIKFAVPLAGLTAISALFTVFSYGF